MPLRNLVFLGRFLYNEAKRLTTTIRGQQFRGGDGIVAKGVENSLRNVGRLGKQGMKETNREIIDIMVGCK